MPKKVIIIGAGIGGVGLSALLAKRGYDVEVFETLSSPGGRAGIFKKDGFTFDTGPSWYLMPEVFERFFNFFGKKADELLKLQRLEPAYKVFFENADPITITADLQKDSQTFEGIEPGAGAKLKKYTAGAEQTYKMALDHFLYTDFTDPKKLLRGRILNKLPKLSYLAVTNLNSYVSRYFKDQRLKQIMEYPMVFLGTSPFSAPAIYSLMSYLDFKQGVFYPKNGIYSVIESIKNLAEFYGVKFHFNSPVEKVVTKNGKATGVMIKNKLYQADIVVSNADLNFTETKLLPPEVQTYPQKYWQKHTAGPSALLMYLGVKGKINKLQHHNLFFTDNWRQNFDMIFNKKQWPKNASMYICKPSQTDELLAPKNHENIFVLVPLPADVKNNTQMQKYADIYLNQISKIIDDPDFKQKIVTQTLFGPQDFANKFNTWNGTALGMAHTLGQSALFRPGIKSKKLNNFFYVGGGTLPGIGLPMCLISAEIVADRITQEFA